MFVVSSSEITSPGKKPERERVRVVNICWVDVFYHYSGHVIRDPVLLLDTVHFHRLGVMLLLPGMSLHPLIPSALSWWSEARWESKSLVASLDSSLFTYVPCISVKNFFSDRVEFLDLFAFDKDFRIIDVVLENALKSVFQVHFA